MEYLWIAVLALATFGLCFLVDKLFSKVFRGSQQHLSGQKVKLRKRTATYGLLMSVLGVACVIFYWGNGVIFWGGLIVLLMGVALLAYYLSFGIYYDENGFVYSRFGRRIKLYTYGQIQNQQLYNSQGSILVELHLKDGSTVPVQDSMDGGFAFLDYAFERWLEANSLNREECSFYDPAQSCWFPPLEVA